MLLKIYSIMDEKANAFNRPFFLSHDGEAMRAFGDLMEDPKSMLNKHPEDFRLYRLGEFDDNEGSIKGIAQPQYLAKGIDFIKVEVVNDKKA